MMKTKGMPTADHNNQRTECRLTKNRSMSVAAIMAAPQMTILGSLRLIEALFICSTYPICREQSRRR